MDSPLSIQFELPSPESDLGLMRANTRLSEEAKLKIKSSLASSFARLVTPFNAEISAQVSCLSQEVSNNGKGMALEPTITKLAEEWKVNSSRVKLNMYAHLLSNLKEKALPDSIRSYQDDGILDMYGELSLGKRSTSIEDSYDADLFRPAKKTVTLRGDAGYKSLQDVIFDYPDTFSAQSFCEIQEPELSKDCSHTGTATPTCDMSSAYGASHCQEGSLITQKRRFIQMKLKNLVSTNFSHKSEGELTTLMSSVYRMSDL